MPILQKKNRRKPCPWGMASPSGLSGNNRVLMVVVSGMVKCVCYSSKLKNRLPDAQTRGNLRVLLYTQ